VKRGDAGLLSDLCFWLLDWAVGFPWSVDLLVDSESIVLGYMFVHAGVVNVVTYIETTIYDSLNNNSFSC
jgi:hypothetical protein